MKYLKIFVLVVFSLGFFSCIDEEGAYFTPASDAKIESRGILPGKWNLTEIGYKSENSVGKVGENSSEASLTFNADNSFVAIFKGSTYTGTWSLSKEMNQINIELPSEQRPAFIAHVPRTWAVMKSNANDLWLDSGEHVLKLAK